MSEWQPIETAPRDGTEVLVYDTGWQFVAKWSAEDGCGLSRPAGFWMSNACADDYTRGDPSHWMPLPAPPTGMTVIDASHLLGDLPPFWMVSRPWEPNPKDLTALERRCAAQAGVEAEDYGHGLIYRSEGEALKVAILMSETERDCEFSIVGSARVIAVEEGLQSRNDSDIRGVAERPSEESSQP